MPDNAGPGNLRYEPDVLATGPLSFDYAMGASGNVDGEVIIATSAATFGYDLADRLTSVTPAMGTAASQSYSYVGQAVTQARVRASAALVPLHAFGYDGQRSLSAVGKYDAAGVQIPTTVCLVHDALGRLTAVGPALARLTGPGAAACQKEADLVSVSTRFEYDAFNRRAARQDGATRVEYVHDPGGHLLAEAVRPASQGGAWTTRREYAWLDGQPLAQLEYPGPAGRTDGWTYAIHADHLGQPRALTNETGATVWSATPVRPYGDVVETATPDPLNGRTVVTNLRLPGQYHERGSTPTDAGLLASVGLQGPYYNWNRWYLPSMGRYLELDPIALSGGFNGDWGPDWYGYAGSNPMAFIDLDGYSKTTGIMKGDDPWLQRLKDAARQGKDAVRELALELNKAKEAGEFDPRRWNKIKAWIKMAKDGRILGGPIIMVVDPRLICGPNMERCRLRERPICDEGA